MAMIHLCNPNFKILVPSQEEYGDLIYFGHPFALLYPLALITHKIIPGR